VFRLTVGITRDFVTNEGLLYFDEAALDSLKAEPKLDVHVMEDPAPTRITADHTARFDSIIMKRSPLTADALGKSDQRLVHVARNGVGYDHLDVKACTHTGVMVTITPEAVQRPVASGIVAFILALAHRLPLKDRMTRTGRWQERNSVLGIGLRGKTLGIVGVGNIGSELFRLIKPWGMKHLGCEPNPPQAGFPDIDVRLADLDSLLKASDFVCLCCPYNDRTRRMIGARELNLMKSHAYLINTARGEIVHEAALIDVLSKNKIAGAAIDVFENEPPSADNPLFKLENVILSSHNISLSDEGNRLGNQAVASAVLAVARGEVPKNVINPEVLDHPRIRKILS
jgi:D-3-phosphoglycerate dehydrogenase